MPVTEVMKISKLRVQDKWWIEIKQSTPSSISHKPCFTTIAPDEDQYEFLNGLLIDGETEVAVEFRKVGDESVNPESIEGLEKALNWLRNYYLKRCGKFPTLSICPSGSGSLHVGEYTRFVFDLAVSFPNTNSLRRVIQSHLGLPQKLTVGELWTVVKKNLKHHTIFKGTLKIQEQFDGWIQKQPKAIQLVWRYNQDKEGRSAIDEWVQQHADEVIN